MKLLTTYTYIKEFYASMGYKFRTDEMALNLGGIRKNDSQSNKFDDLGFMAWKEEGKENLLTFAITTDPGKAYLLKPMNKNGTIIMVPGQYIEVFGRGLHNGQYECFKQRGRMCYVRDNSKDDILDFDLYRNPEKRKIHAFWGINGTNCHRASEWKLLNLIGLYSAGCQVVQSAKIFKQLIELRDRSVKFGYSFWDYTLFEESEYNSFYLEKTKESFDLLTHNQNKQQTNDLYDRVPAPQTRILRTS